MEPESRGPVVIALIGSALSGALVVGILWLIAWAIT